MLITQDKNWEANFTKFWFVIKWLTIDITFNSVKIICYSELIDQQESILLLC